MNGKVRFVGLSFLVCSLLLSGCSPSDQGESLTPSRVDEVKKTPTEEEKARLLKAIDRKFEDPAAHFELGQLYQMDGMWAQAEYRYNITLSFDPVHRGAQAAMVKTLLGSGNTAKAKLSAEIYLNQVCASAEESLRLGLAFQQQQLDDYALVCYQQALRLAPNSAKVNRQIGYYYLSKNRRELAREYLTRSFQLNPNQPEVSGELGRLGVAVKIPRKTEKDVKKLDRIVEQSDKQIKP